MGTKRIGLARMEALMEALKREITGFNVEGTAASITTINSSSVTLARNSVNVVTRAGATDLAMPAAADCRGTGSGEAAGAKLRRRKKRSKQLLL